MASLRETARCVKNPDYKCVICGEETTEGGYWLGRGGEIVICASPACVMTLLHLAVDALVDVPWRDGIGEEYQEWRQMTDDVFEVKLRGERV